MAFFLSCARGLGKFTASNVFLLVCRPKAQEDATSKKVADEKYTKRHGFSRTYTISKLTYLNLHKKPVSSNEGKRHKVNH